MNIIQAIEDFLVEIFYGDSSAHLYEPHITVKQSHQKPMPPVQKRVLTNPSPNFYEGRDTHKPIAVVIHRSGGSLSSCDSWFADRHSQVSAHYCVGKDGTVHSYVYEFDTAYHAGVAASPTWKLYNSKINPNLVTIGIEHEGLEDDVWTDVQKNASAILIKNISNRWGIFLNRDHIIGHYEINGSTRPNCPAVDKSIIDELIELSLRV